MNKRFLGIGAASAAAVLVLAGCSQSESPDESLTVFAAASTRVLNDDIEAMRDHAISFVNAGSSDLVQQLVDGAPADVLITADARTMNNAVDAKVVENPVVVAQNKLVLVTPADNPANIASLEDATGADANVVACDPQVPCGAVTEQLMEKNNETLNPKSLEHSVTDVLGKVVSGEAYAGFVYATDASAAGDDVQVIEIPHADEFPNELVAAVTAQTEDKAAAQDLVDFLQSEEASTMWKKHGFSPVN